MYCIFLRYLWVSLSVCEIKCIWSQHQHKNVKNPGRPLWVYLRFQWYDPIWHYISHYPYTKRHNCQEDSAIRSWAHPRFHLSCAFTFPVCHLQFWRTSLMSYSVRTLHSVCLEAQVKAEAMPQVLPESLSQVAWRVVEYLYSIVS